MMKLRPVVLITVLVALISPAACRDRGTTTTTSSQTHSFTRAEVYYCPMHPTVISDKPGNCPICGMKLVRRTDPSGGLSGSGDEPSQEITLSREQRSLAQLATTVVHSAPANETITATGRVTFDERRLAQVSAYTSGRVEQLFANFTGDVVRRGATVATIYSPELLAAQQEYLLAITNRDRMRSSGFDDARKGSEDLVESARRRLMLLGMSSARIDQVAGAGKAFPNTPITSPVSGIVVRKNVVPQQYVTQGQSLLDIADLSTVWVEADVNERDVSRVRTGQRVSVTAQALGATQIPGTVAFVNPLASPELRAARVRIELPNADLRLKPEMVVTVRLATEGRLAITIPRSALIERGSQTFVWVEVAPSRYAPRAVTPSTNRSDGVEIAAGLREGERVVTNGVFLLDSESQLREATR